MARTPLRDLRRIIHRCGFRIVRRRGRYRVTLTFFKPWREWPLFRYHDTEREALADILERLREADVLTEEERETLGRPPTRMRERPRPLTDLPVARPDRQSTPVRPVSPPGGRAFSCS